MDVQKTNEIQPGYPLQPQTEKVQKSTNELKEELKKELGEKLISEIEFQGKEQTNKIWDEMLEEEQKKIENNSAQKTTDKSKDQDTSKISPERVRNAENIWTLEELTELWNALLNWSPDALKNISSDMEELAQLYEALLRAVLEQTKGSQQAAQLERLDQALSLACNRLINDKLYGMTSLFKEFGGTEVMAAFKASIYQLITHQSLQPEEMEHFWSSGSFTSQPANKVEIEKNTEMFVRQGNQQSMTETVRKGSMEQGSIYQFQKKGTVISDKQFLQEIKENGIRLERLGNGQEAVKISQEERGNLVSWKNNRYMANDFDQTEPFARHMEEKGNLFINGELQNESDELTGVFASIMWVKGQVFAMESGVSNPMANTVQYVVDKMIDYYLFQKNYYVQDTEKQQAHIGNMRKHRGSGQKEAYEIYYHVLNLYHKNKNPAQAITKGLLYAWERFHQKQSLSEDLQKTETLKKTDSFWGMAGMSLLEEQKIEWEKGKNILEKDWKLFLDTIKQNNKNNLPLELLEQSPWGIVTAPQMKHLMKSAKSRITVFLMLGGMIAIAALILNLIR